MSGAELAEPRETPCIERLLGLLMDLGQDFRSHSRSHERALDRAETGQGGPPRRDDRDPVLRPIFAGRCPRQEPTGRVLVAGPEPADDRVLDLCMNLTARGGAHPNDLARWSPAVTTPEPEGGASLLRKGLVRETHRCPCCSHRLKLSEA